MKKLFIVSGLLLSVTANASLYDTAKEVLQNSHDSSQELASTIETYRDQARAALVVIDSKTMSHSAKLSKLDYFIQYADANCKVQAQHIGDIGRAECVSKTQAARTLLGQDDLQGLRKMTQNVERVLSWSFEAVNLF